jgi:lipopolysaccharide/colanic/teichoic acid biosynthesis glycosyltransferase
MAEAHEAPTASGAKAGIRTLVLGTGELACDLIDAIESQPRPRHQVVGVIAEDADAPTELCGYPVLGTAQDLTRLLEQTRATTIVLAAAERRGRLPVHRLLALGLRGVVIENGVELYEHLTGKVAIEFVNPGEWLSTRRLRGPRWHACLARALSLVAGVAGLVVLSPLLALIALAIKLDSRGPVFFVHRRVGLHGQPFALIKFRSMHPARTQRSEWAGDNSDRVTRVGRLLRKFWLDELPELWNLVRGDMNLIGPRPHPVSNWMLFSMVLRNVPCSGHSVPYCSLRALVRPGLSGWAQVRYRYANNLEEEIEKVKYDLYYVKYRSLRMDLAIVLATIRLMVSGRGTAPLEQARATPEVPARPAPVASGELVPVREAVAAGETRKRGRSAAEGVMS